MNHQNETEKTITDAIMTTTIYFEHGNDLHKGSIPYT